MTDNNERGCCGMPSFCEHPCFHGGGPQRSAEVDAAGPVAAAAPQHAPAGLQAAHDAIAAAPAAPVAQPVAPAGMPTKDVLTELIASMLAGTYHCARVWGAWQIGTMSEDDFAPADESDTPAEIADAVLAMLAAAPAAPAPASVNAQLLPVLREYMKAADQAWRDLCAEAQKAGIQSMWILPSHAVALEKFNALRAALAAAEAQPAPVAREPLTQAATDVLAERQRQISAEGWTPEHDDKHADGSLAEAASCYAGKDRPDGMCPGRWPWRASWWKPKDRRSDLIRAGALILAEIERLDRAAGITPAQEGGAA